MRIPGQQQAVKSESRAQPEEYGRRRKSRAYEDEKSVPSVEGLVHISQILRGKRLERTEDAGHKVGGKVRVKLLDIKIDGKLSFSIKDADESRSELKGSVKKSFEAKFDQLGRRIGPITGILLDDTNTRITKKH